MSPPPALDVLGFCHLGIVVPDLDQFLDTWGALLGLQDWTTKTTEQPAGQFQLHGTVIEEPTSSRVVFFTFKGVAIEVIQPGVGSAASSEHLRMHGPGVNHIALWVDDLPAQLDKVRDITRITYAAASLAGRATVARVEGITEQAASLPFWAYIEPLVNPANIALELLDAGLADEFRRQFGAHAFYPGDLPGTQPVPGRD